MLMMVEPILAMRMSAFSVRADFDAHLVITLELPIHFIRLSTMIMMFRVWHDSLKGYESTRGRDKQLYC
jgi:hypothetical protein